MSVASLRLTQALTFVLFCHTIITLASILTRPHNSAWKNHQKAFTSKDNRESSKCVTGVRKNKSRMPVLFPLALDAKRWVVLVENRSRGTNYIKIKVIYCVSRFGNAAPGFNAKVLWAIGQRLPSQKLAIAQGM